MCFDYEAVVVVVAPAADACIFLLILWMMMMTTKKNELITIDSNQFDSLFDQAQLFVDFVHAAAYVAIGYSNFLHPKQLDHRLTLIYYLNSDPKRLSPMVSIEYTWTPMDFWNSIGTLNEHRVNMLTI